MKINGFTLIELMVVIAICGVLAVVGVPMYQNFQESSKKAAIMSNCATVKAFIPSQVLKCEFNPSGSLELMKDGGIDKIHKVSCSPEETTTNELMIALINHLGNIGIKNPYGNVGGFTSGVHGIMSICRGGETLDCDEELLAIDGRPKAHRGRVFISTQPGNYQIACYYDPEKWTTPVRYIDAR